jgi:hypothetical protein
MIHWFKKIRPFRKQQAGELSNHWASEVETPQIDGLSERHAASYAGGELPQGFEVILYLAMTYKFGFFAEYLWNCRFFETKYMLVVMDQSCKGKRL